MSSDSPRERGTEQTPVLRREALLPTERGRGLGTVAVVCTMAGVASGLALATTLMAMQVADSMSTRGCPYHVQEVMPDQDHGFLGIRYVFHDGFADIESVVPDTAAQANHLRHGDHIVRINGQRIESAADLQEQIFNSHPGTVKALVIEHDGAFRTIHPKLGSWPAAITY
jgi:S1-C subfamily serine protease